MVFEITRIAMVGLLAAALCGCGEERRPAGERPPEARATPRALDDPTRPHGAPEGGMSAVRHGYSADGKPVPHDPQANPKQAGP